MDALLALAVGAAALLTAIVGGATGIGSAIAMIAVLTFAIGIREAVPIVTIAVTIQTVSRVWANRAFIDYRVARWFILGALPAAALGSIAFANAPVHLLARGLAIFLFAIVIYRHLPVGRAWRMDVRAFVPVGFIQGFLSALFGGAGPFGALFFLVYGLTRNAFVGTMALAMTSINIVKMTVYGTYTLLDGTGLVIAGALGLIMLVGAYIGGALVHRLSDRVFVYLVEAVIAAAAVALLVRG